MLRHRGPPLVVDGAVAHNISKYWVSCRSAALASLKAVEHARALDRVLLDAVHRDRLGNARRLEDCGRHVDDVAELRADLALGLDPLGPVDDRAVARAAEVRGDLLGPLVGRVHGVRPAHRIVVVGLGPAQLVEPCPSGTRASRTSCRPLK